MSAVFQLPSSRLIISASKRLTIQKNKDPTGFQTNYRLFWKRASQADHERNIRWPVLPGKEFNILKSQRETTNFIMMILNNDSTRYKIAKT